jgi:uncharacterized protein DUF5309
MAGITGQGDTFNLPNYVGELFGVTPTDTPFLSAIGGLTGGERANASLFQWQGYDLRDADHTRQRTEGADAPTPEARVRFNVNNVVEIHQEAVEISYTKQAAVGQFASTGSSHTGAVGLSGSNPVTNEYAWQVQQALVQIARDVEVSFIKGTFNNPSTDATARRTRGIIQAIVTNVMHGGGGALTEDLILDLLQKVWENGGIMVSETATLMCNAFQKRQLTEIFITSKNYQELSRNVAGVSLTTFETDFGRLNIMLNRHMPTDQVVVVSLEECAPVLLEIPGKGFLFQEDLAKTGASDKTQIYGEIGLKYGNEKKHGRIENLSVQTVGS